MQDLLLNSVCAFIIACMEEISTATKNGQYQDRDMCKTELSFVCLIGNVMSNLTFLQDQRCLTFELSERMEFAEKIYSGTFAMNQTHYRNLINVLKAFIYFYKDCKNYLRNPALTLFIQNYQQQNKGFNLEAIRREQKRLHENVFRTNTYDIDEIRFLHYRISGSRYSWMHKPKLQLHWF